MKRVADHALEGCGMLGWVLRSCVPCAVGLGGGWTGILLTGSGAREKRQLRRDDMAASGIRVQGQLRWELVAPCVVLGS